MTIAELVLTAFVVYLGLWMGKREHDKLKKDFENLRLDNLVKNAGKIAKEMRDLKL